MDSIHEGLLKNQQETVQSFFKQMRTAGTQNLGPATVAANIGQGAGATENAGGQIQDQNAEQEGNRQGPGGRPSDLTLEDPQM